jgi:Transglutaminase-like superfamily
VTPQADLTVAAARRPLRAQRPLGHAECARLLVEILVSYLLARRALRRGPIASVLASMRSGYALSTVPARSDPQSLEEVLARARRLGHAVLRTLALVPGDTRCLVRSLVLMRLLAKRGIPAKLVIGARATPAFLAHAWVEYAGEPVISAGDGSFARLVEL